MTTFSALKAPPQTSPTPPTADSTRQTTAVGLDVGNGAVKLYSSLGQILQESYVLYLPERATHANAGYVEYLSARLYPFAPRGRKQAR